MPAPKASTRIKVSLHAPLPDCVGLETLKPYLDEETLSKVDEKYDESIRSAVSFYVGSVKSTPVKTIGQRKALLKRISTASKRLLDAIKKQDEEKTQHWNNRLYEILSSWDSKEKYTQNGKRYEIGTAWDSDTRSIVYNCFNQPPKDTLALAKEVTAFTHELRDYRHGKKHSENTKTLLAALIGIDKDFVQSEKKLQGRSQRFTDPHLADLLRRLMPIWTAATGHPPKLGSKSTIQENPFALWIQSLLRAAQVRAPLASTIVDIAKKISK